MTCPRCGNEWDVSKSPCLRCGLLVRLPGRLGSRAGGTSVIPPQKTPLQPSQLSGNMPAVKPLNSFSAPAVSNKQSSNAAGANNSNMASPSPAPGFARESMNTARSPYQTPSTLPSQEQKSVNSSASAATGMDISRTPLGFPDLENSSLGRNVPTSDAFSRPTSGNPKAGMPPTYSVSPRPNFAMPEARGIDAPISNTPRPSSARSYSNSVVTDPLTKDGAQAFSASASSAWSQQASGTPGMYNSARALPASDVHSLMPGTPLRGGRYRLQELQVRQDWLGGVYECWWMALDAMRGNTAVEICEVATPDSNSMVIQSALRSATMALTSVGRHPSIPTLWDAFGEQGRNFFVFEPVEGESLLSRMRRTGRALPEQDVVACCLQMLDVIELLNQQSPPLVHGLIRPEHIVEKRSGQFVLTNFSIILAGGATQFVGGLERSRLTPYMAPEMARGVLDMRSDLYSLLASAYHAVTGSVPSSADSLIPAAQRLNPMVSPQFDAILSKGLRANAAQRYQRPAELRQELLALRSVNGSVVPVSAMGMRSAEGNGVGISQSSKPSQSFQSSPGSIDNVAQFLPNILSSALEDDERKLLLPRPDELPAITTGNDKQIAYIWTVAILVALLAVVFLSGRPL